MSGSKEIYVRRRLEVIVGLISIGFLILVIRAVDLQWYQADKLQQRAEKQRQRQFAVAAPRGAIKDARGRMLAESIEVPSISAIADEVPSDRVGDLAKAIGMDSARLKRKLVGQHGFTWLARQVDPAKAKRVMALQIPGVRQEMEWRRYHPLGPETGHLLGFVGVDGHGLEGLEYSLDHRLSGRQGRELVIRDARGHALPGGVWLQKPRPGKAAQLYVDATIQSLAYAALVEGVKRQGAKGGSIVVMRPRDGAVLAMANWPSYNPNNFGKFKPSEWRNRAVTDMLEPGSALKPFTIAAALESGHWRTSSRVFCEKGRFRVADYVIHDDHPEGWLNLTGILAKSSNIGAAKLATDIGPKAMYRMFSAVGLGRKTGIGLSGESPGMLLPSNRWGPVETATIAFGQGVAVTPLQLATAFCVLANGGMRVHPKLVKGASVRPPKRVMPEYIADTVRRMLEKAASPDGTGALAVPAGYPVAGKTGTAQKPDGHGGYAKGQFTAVFAGMVPADHPRLVIAVTVDRPQKSIYGGVVAAPIFRNVASAVLPYLGLPPEDSQPSPAWHALQVADHVSGSDGSAAPAGTVPTLFGKSLREVRNMLASRGYQLHVHGSGWVAKQSPSPLSKMPEGGAVEVWLDD
ncbi:MAG TPA: penicillin-binding protein [Mariprofundaceae bacterium]|nr:penicillin-binding protein [Mariprofundaceae bacterium]